jgi:predicted lipoprotein with Yx(FWY)xxD motif
VRRHQVQLKIGVFVVACVTLAVLAASASASRTSHLSIRATTYGRILTDGGGFALYAFTRDGRGTSRCSGACAAAWPPLIVKHRPQGRRGARSSLIGVRRRSDGRLQATYNGRPLYYYVGDRKPGQVLCQDVFEYGGRWLVIRASGALVR